MQGGEVDANADVLRRQRQRLFQQLARCFGLAQPRLYPCQLVQRAGLLARQLQGRPVGRPRRMQMLLLMAQRLVSMAQPRIDQRRFLTAAQCILIGAHRPAVAALGREAKTQLGIGAALVGPGFHQAAIKRRRLLVSPARHVERRQRKSRLGVRRIAFERMRRPLLCLCQLAPRQASQWPLTDDFPRLALRGRRIDISAPGKQYHQ